MTKVDFRTMNDLRHKAELLAMMRALYSEDATASPADQSRFPLNIEFLVAHPSRGRIVLFSEGELLRGYALLIPYWSNEFGGTLLFVDEIFVTAEARNRGIGRSFFRFLAEQRPFDAVALALEVSPGNAGARRLYKSLGFTPRRNSVLTYASPGRPTKRRENCKAPPQRSEIFMAQQPIKPPFTEQTARLKVQAAEEAWNTRDPERVAMAYSEDSEWRNRTEFLRGREEIRAFLRRKWAKELDYRLKKTLWTFRENRIAVSFEYEWHDASGQWYRSYGNELWEFDENGLMRRRLASINDAEIASAERVLDFGATR